MRQKTFVTETDRSRLCTRDVLIKSYKLASIYGPVLWQMPHRRCYLLCSPNLWIGGLEQKFNQMDIGSGDARLEMQRYCIMNYIQGMIACKYVCCLVLYHYYSRKGCVCLETLNATVLHNDKEWSHANVYVAWYCITTIQGRVVCVLKL